MVDWLSLARNNVWVLGLAFTVAAISYAEWEGDRQFASRSLFWAVGACLFSLGMALRVSFWILGLLWSGLALAFAGQGWRAWRSGQLVG